MLLVAQVLLLLAHSTKYYCHSTCYHAVIFTSCRYFQVPRRLIDMAEQQVRTEALVAISSSLQPQDFPAS